MNSKTYRRCVRCVLSERFPGIAFDSSGVCNYCCDAGPIPDIKLRQNVLRHQLDQIIGEARSESKSEYQCVVAFSGGKDSSITLKLLTQHYGLRCIAVTVDNGFLSDQAIVNCRLIADALGVDHEFHRPNFSFMRRLYNEAATGGLQVASATKRASAICNSCISLINTHMMKLALRLGAPLVAGGYLGGQVPPGAGVMTFTHGGLVAARHAMDTVYEKRLGAEAQFYMSLASIGAAVADDRLIRIINPLLAWPIPEEDIVAELSTLGWRRPTDTGLNSSNCRLNDLGVLMHWRKHGFHPYEGELADLVRTGVMSREDALAKLDQLPTMSEVADIATRLNLAI